MSVPKPTRGLPLGAPTNKPSLRTRRQAGFTMLELSFILSAMAGLVVALAYLTTDLFTKRQGMDGDRLLLLADAQVKEFAARRGRLPCPDTSNDGVENCEADPSSKGFLPYRTLGLSTQTYVVGETPLRYGVYRQSSGEAAADADLSVRKLRFSPKNSDGTAYPDTSESQANTADFCLALANAGAGSFSATRTYVSYPSGGQQNVAYAIAFPGAANRDLGATRYDLLNATSGPGFQARNTPPASNYDDKTVHRGFNELYLSLNCEVVLRSLNFVADAVAFEEEVHSLADSNKEAAFVGTILAGVGTGVAAWGLAQSIAEVAGAAEVLGVSIGLLSTAAGTCPIPPWVTCALIPVYSVAVATAGTGVGLAAAGAALNGAAVGLQIAATVKYAGIKSRTGLDRPSTPPPASADELAALESDLDAKQAEVLAAEGALQRALNDEAALRVSAAAQRTALEALIDRFVDADPTSFDAKFAETFTSLDEAMFGKDTGATESVTIRFTDANGDEKTNTIDRPVVEPGVYQALLDLREARQAYSRAETAHQSAIDSGESAGVIQDALNDKNEAQSELSSAETTLVNRRNAVPAVISSFDTYDRARVTQASSKATRDEKTAAYESLYASCQSNPAECDSAALNEALAEKNAAVAAYDAATTARATAYNALGASGTDSGEGGLCGAAACNVQGSTESYLTAELRLDTQVSRTEGDTVISEAATSDRLAKQRTVSTLRSERDALEIQVGINTCALSNKDYDSINKVCTNDAPGTASANATQNAVCDTNADTYDAPACAALTAAGETPPEALAPVQGAENILRSLKREGVVR